ncbi:hypothetical protein YC2023_075752 [Brassica napus]|uniref:Uncharacterized protein n=2 Tax=Brassica oleracea TaxID=3712 RepID=A0A0D3CQ64_BRAOL|nr:PREDICTED: uncharacterized protein LOC106299153 [Brassica oleracea var. oleracea]VDD60374.1 unnamed protein product [Brassica oleracea]
MDHQNVPITKKLWNVVRFLLYIIRKRVRKHKLIADFSATLKRGKNLMFHHRRRVHAADSTSSNALNAASSAAATAHLSHSSLFSCVQTPQTLDDDAAAARAVLELLNGVSDKGNVTPEAFSKALSLYFPGFGRTPLVRPLRVTDSPFPLTPGNGDVARRQVNQAADDFIKNFYNNLNQQKKMLESS